MSYGFRSVTFEVSIVRLTTAVPGHVPLIDGIGDGAKCDGLVITARPVSTEFTVKPEALTVMVLTVLEVISSAVAFHPAGVGVMSRM